MEPLGEFCIKKISLPLIKLELSKLNHYFKTFKIYSFLVVIYWSKLVFYIETNKHVFGRDDINYSLLVIVIKIVINIC